MKQRNIIILLTMLLGIVAIQTFAYDAKVNGIYYYLNKSTRTATVTYESYNANSYSGNVVIPETITNAGISYRVTSIGWSAFSGCTDLSAVTFPNTVTYISAGSFSDCSSLTSITIPSSVESINGNPFRGCSGLSSIKVSSENKKYNSSNNCNAIIETTTNNLITGCKNTIIPSNVKTIGSYAFENCTGLSAISIPNGVTTIDYDAFKGCSGLTAITIPNSVTTIDNSAFEGCTSLTSITLPSSVTEVGSNVFKDTPWFSNLPDGVVYIGKVAYLYKGTMPSNTTIEIRDGTVAIGESAFLNRSFLTSISLPNSITAIGRSAFRGCSNLTTVNIPDGITSIGSEAFYGCYSLTKLDIPGSVRIIGGSAFFNCSSLSSLTLSEGITTIGHQAFDFCYALTSVTIPKSVKKFEGIAFGGCTGLQSIIVEDGNQVFDSRENCNAIIETSTNTLITGCKTTIIPESVTCIGDHAFWCCRSLQSINIPKNVKSLSGSGFQDCQELKSITVDTNNPYYDSRYNCNAIINSKTHELLVGSNSTILPKDIKKIGDRAFEGRRSLPSVLVIPEGVDSLGCCVFDHCQSLEKITIPSSISYISAYAFEYCTRLTDVYCYAIEIPKTEWDVFRNSNFSEATLHVRASSLATYQSTEPWSNFKEIVPIEEEKTYDWTIGTDGDFANINEAMSDSRVKDGDVLQVMKSNTAITGTQTVTKAVTIQGNGYESLNDGWLNGDLYVNCTGVTLKGLYVSGDIYLRDEKATIERCRVTSIKTPNNYDSDNATIRGCLITGTVGGNSSNSAYYWNVYNNIILGTVAYIEESTFNHNAIVSAADGIVLLEPIVHDVIGSSFTNNIVFASNKQTVFSDNTLNSVTKFEYNIHSNSSNPSGFATNIYGYETIGKLFTCTGKEGTDAYYQTASGSPAIGYANDGGDCGPWSGSFPYKLNGIDEASEGGGGTGTDDQLVEPNDLLALKNLYQAFGGSGWTTKKWSFENNGSKLEDFPGVTFDANGRVTAIDLQDNGLVGECFQVSSPQLSELTSLNLSRNKISGDLGKLVGQLAKLTKLDMSYNRLTKTDGVMAFSEGFSSNINVRYQNRVYQSSSSTTSAFTDNVATMAAPTITIGQTMKIDIPSLYTYDYKYGEHRLNPPFKVREPGTPSTNMAQLVYNGSSNYTNGSTYSFSYSGLYLKPQDQRVVLVDEWSSYACYSAFPVTLHYEEGDADMTGETNVLDVQYTLNFILAPNSQSRFNWSAADTYTDMNINVQDIVQTVNIILGLPRHPNYASRMAEDGGESEATDGYVYARQGSIMLTAERNVAAIDIDLEGVSTSEVALMLNRRDFQMIGRNTEWGSRYIIFSPTGKSIPAGTTAQLLRMSGAGEPMSVECSDPDAQPVWLSVGSAPTGIGEAVATAASDSSTYNLSGQRVEKPRKGIYLQQGRKVVVK